MVRKREKSRRIKELRAKISNEREKISKLKLTIANVVASNGRSYKNILLLEKKIVSHVDRISKSDVSNIEIQKLVLSAKEKLIKKICDIINVLFHMFVIEKHDMKSSGIQYAWTPRTLDKKYTINSNEAHCLTSLKSELCSGSGLTRDSLSSLAALIYMASLVGVLSTIYGVFLPYSSLPSEFCLWSTRLTEDSFTTHLFKLNYSILILCCALGVSTDKLNCNEPFENIYQLSSKVHHNGQIFSLSASFDSKIRHQILDEFNSIRWKESGQELMFDNVEEGWVKVSIDK